MGGRLEARVRQRARQACEYCQMPCAFYRVPFQVDHIIAKQHRGKTNLGNLALSCYRRNLHKGPNIASLDPSTGRLVRLFNPRRDAWSKHFRWRGPWLVGKTGIGRATITLLAINDPIYVAVRESLIAERVFPTTS